MFGRRQAPVGAGQEAYQVHDQLKGDGNELRRRCDKSHQHQPLVDGRAKDAARYPPAMCKAICRGIMKEKMQRRLQVRAVLEVGEGVHKRVVDTEEFHDDELVPGSPVGTGLGPTGDSGISSKDPVVYRLNKLSIKNGDVSSALAWDDLTGMRLDAGKVKEARNKDIQYIRDKQVWVKIPRRSAQARGWKVIKTRWIDINKGYVC